MTQFKTMLETFRENSTVATLSVIMDQWQLEHKPAELLSLLKTHCAVELLRNQVDAKGREINCLSLPVTVEFLSQWPLRPEQNYHWPVVLKAHWLLWTLFSAWNEKAPELGPAYRRSVLNKLIQGLDLKRKTYDFHFQHLYIIPHFLINP